MRRGTAIVLALLMLAGCVNTNKPRASTQPVTAVDEKVAASEYWLKKPAVTSAQGEAFFPVWQACEKAIRQRGFEMDRMDQRRALMTSKALVGKDWLEVWRSDVVGGKQLTRSTMATVRRTIYLNVSRDAQGVYRVEPKVVIERFSQEEHRITAAVSYDQIFLKVPPEEERTMEGRTWPAAYWYATGRDEKLEKALAEDIQAEIGRENAADPATRVGG